MALGAKLFLANFAYYDFIHTAMYAWCWKSSAPLRSLVVAVLAGVPVLQGDAALDRRDHVVDYLKGALDDDVSDRYREEVAVLSCLGRALQDDEGTADVLDVDPVLPGPV